MAQRKLTVKKTQQILKKNDFLNNRVCFVNKSDYKFRFPHTDICIDMSSHILAGRAAIVNRKMIFDDDFTKYENKSFFFKN